MGLKEVIPLKRTEPQDELDAKLGERARLKAGLEKARVELEKVSAATADARERSRDAGTAEIIESTPEHRRQAEQTRALLAAAVNRETDLLHAVEAAEEQVEALDAKITRLAAAVRSAQERKLLERLSARAAQREAAIMGAIDELYLLAKLTGLVTSDYRLLLDRTLGMKISGMAISDRATRLRQNLLAEVNA